MDDLVQRRGVQDRNTITIRIHLTAHQPFPSRQKDGNCERISAKHPPVGQASRSQIKQQTPALFGAKPRQPHRDAAIVVNEGQVKHATVEAGDFGYVVAASQSPQIAPFPAAQILLTGLWPGARQQPSGFAQIALQPRLVSEIDVRCVEVPSGAVAFHFGFALRESRGLPGLPLRLQQRLLGAFRARGPHRLRGADSQRNSRRRGEGQLVATNGFLDPIRSGGRPRDHRLLIQVPLEVHRQPVGRVVASRPVFFQALHHDPIEVALEQMDQFRRVGRTAPGGRRQFFTLQCRQTRARSHRLPLADRLAHPVDAGGHQLLRIERRASGQ